MKRLAIVVPYRDRAEHLGHFVPHLRAFFEHDHIHRHIPYRVIIVEQDRGRPFNRGALKNIGFVLRQDDSDYTCFHDIDLLPLKADYRWTDAPMSIVWEGAATRPIAPGRSECRISEELERWFGGVLLVPNAAFSSVDGYANTYWGWGYEDVDLRRRFESAGIAISRRMGRFKPLEHDNLGYTVDGKPSPQASVNRQLFAAAWAPNAAKVPDGISTLDYELLERRSALPDGTHALHATWETVRVRLNMQPRQDHGGARVDSPPATDAPLDFGGSR